MNTEHLTATEAMELLRISRNQLYRLIYAGKVTAYKPSGRLLFKRSELMEYIEEGKVEPHEPVYHNVRKTRRKKSGFVYVPGMKVVG